MSTAPLRTFSRDAELIVVSVMSPASPAVAGGEGAKVPQRRQIV